MKNVLPYLVNQRYMGLQKYFERVLYLAKLKKYTVLNQMMNYSGKVIALLIEKEGLDVLYHASHQHQLSMKLHINGLMNIVQFLIKIQRTLIDFKDTKGEVTVAPQLR